MQLKVNVFARNIRVHGPIWVLNAANYFQNYIMVCPALQIYTSINNSNLIKNNYWSIIENIGQWYVVFPILAHFRQLICVQSLSRTNQVIICHVLKSSKLIIFIPFEIINISDSYITTAGKEGCTCRYILNNYMDNSI